MADTITSDPSGKPMRVVSGERFGHVKTGKTYQIVGTFEHTETGEHFVAYHEAADRVTSGKAWVRPLTMFCDGRFEWLPVQG